MQALLPPLTKLVTKFYKILKSKDTIYPLRYRKLYLIEFYKL